MPEAVRVMERRTWLRLTAAGLAARALAIAEEAAVPVFQSPHMGTMWTIRAAAEPDVAAKAAAAAWVRIAELEQVLSDYRKDSELSRLTATAGRGETVQVSEDLWRVLTAAQTMAERSGGLFDVTVGPCTALWREAKRRRRLPSSEALAAAREATGWRHLVLEPDKKRVRLLRPGMRLDAGGVAKGYAQDEALAVLSRHGVRAALVDAGGGVAVGAAPSGRAAWHVQLQPSGDSDPDIAAVTDACVSTSGDLHQAVEIDGRRFSHIVDPRTGLGMETSGYAVAVAGRAMDSDMMATVLCLMGPKAGVAWLAREWPEAAGRVVWRRGSAAEVEVAQTDSFVACLLRRGG